MSVEDLESAHQQDNGAHRVHPVRSPNRDRVPEHESARVSRRHIFVTPRFCSRPKNHARPRVKTVADMGRGGRLNAACPERSAKVCRGATSCTLKGVVQACVGSITHAIVRGGFGHMQARGKTRQAGYGRLAIGTCAASRTTQSARGSCLEHSDRVVRCGR